MRGRPKGTGIDDTEVLYLLRQALKDNPSRTVSGEARRLGLGPSAIRRLREKMKNGTNSSAR